MTTLVAHAQVLVAHLVGRFQQPPGRARRAGGEAGQSTVEYALVILAAAALALLVVAWAARTGRIEALFDRVVDSVTSKVT